MYNKYWYDEKNVDKVMRAWVQSKGFKLMPETFNLHGVDIRAFSNKMRKYWFIEVKGYPREKASMNAQKQEWFVACVGQIIKRMKQKNGKYGIAFPDFEFYEKKSLELPKIARDRLKLNIFLINKNKNIRQLTPKANKFKLIN
jgi:hypothetical protein